MSDKESLKLDKTYFSKYGTSSYASNICETTLMNEYFEQNNVSSIKIDSNTWLVQRNAQAPVFSSLKK